LTPHQTDTYLHTWMAERLIVGINGRKAHR
jgi:hypothetical protein